MWRRLNREDLSSSNPLLSTRENRLDDWSWQIDEFRWSVYDDYELVELENGQFQFDDRYFVASKNASLRRSYEPLVETPHLFLEFARLYERRNTDEAIGEWIRKFGLLGLQKNEARPYGISTRIEYSNRGGPQETVDDVWGEVSMANKVLTLYEAALSKDVEKLEEIFHIEGTSHEAQRRRESFRSDVKRSGLTYVDSMVKLALHVVVGRVEDVLEAFAFPCFGSLAPSGGSSPERWWTPELLTASWSPRNLLGAMYLQFYWLMTSFNDLSRCKHCGRIISYAPPLPRRGKVRKPRKDKEFCDQRCRQNYNYHHRIKPARSARSS